MTSMQGQRAGGEVVQQNGAWVVRVGEQQFVCASEAMAQTFLKALTRGQQSPRASGQV